MSEQNLHIPALSIWDVDAVLNLRAGLLRSDRVYAYPDQLSVFVDQAGQSAPFAHGVPGSSGLGSVNFVLDKQKRRALMERAEIPIPRGATFSFGSGLRRARSYAKELGFPVTLKPTRGDNGADAQLDVKNLAEFDEAVSALSLPPEERPHHTRSGYRQALIGEPTRDDEGNVRVGRAYRFTVEKHVRGALLRFLIVDREVLSVTACDGSPSDGSYRGGQDVTASTTAPLKVLAIQAAQSVPGLNTSVIDIVVRDNSPLNFVRTKAVVVDFNERPNLWVQDKVNPKTAADLAERIFDSYADSGGFDFKPTSYSGKCQIEAKGLADAEAATKILEAVSSHFGCGFSPENVDRLSGRVTGVITGGALEVARMVTTIVKGSIAGLRFPELSILPY